MRQTHISGADYNYFHFKAPYADSLADASCSSNYLNITRPPEIFLTGTLNRFLITVDNDTQTTLKMAVRAIH